MLRIRRTHWIVYYCSVACVVLRKERSNSATIIVISPLQARVQAEMA